MSQYPRKAALGQSGEIKFSKLAHEFTKIPALRANLTNATGTIRNKRASVVSEVSNWQTMRTRAAMIKDDSLANLDDLIKTLIQSVQERGGQVHFAHDARSANEIIVGIAKSHNFTEAIKVKSITTDEIGVNDALAKAGIKAQETDLAELIVQLAGEMPSHILVPAIHKNRDEIAELFSSTISKTKLENSPAILAEAARVYLREKFLSVPFGISGANFAVADSGSIAIVESEGNGRMCLTLPDVLVTVMGIEKVIKSFQDVPLFMELLARSSTGERMNPYTTIFHGVTPGDGPQEFHLVLLDNNRSSILSDPVSFETLRCIRCSACLNVCPVYERASGFSYGSVYQGPIGAILVPQLLGPEQAGSLAFASTLCGACYEVCPVKINIPRILTYLRSRANEANTSKSQRRAFAVASVVMSNPKLLRTAYAGVGFGNDLAAKIPKKLIDAIPLMNKWTKSRGIPSSRRINKISGKEK
ncbi:lactate utilization protein B [Acidithrix sp. C25]|uniref:lactate utilization protein B n=1 Tax=Acidithrix sp. C25 TaxID=1671482 RepID=UPI00191BA405|nr:lactate utilization protein B [Acidithrix sp. C25]CAG4913693.1 unnamed protein product [Acidithrix sp. C25]